MPLFTSFRNFICSYMCTYAYQVFALLADVNEVEIYGSPARMAFVYLLFPQSSTIVQSSSIVCIFFNYLELYLNCSLEKIPTLSAEVFVIVTSFFAVIKSKLLLGTSSDSTAIFLLWQLLLSHNQKNYLFDGFLFQCYVF